MNCVACGLSDPDLRLRSVVSTDRRPICPRCLRGLPAETQSAYFSGNITTKQVVEALRTRTASVRTFGGGHRRW